MPVLFTRVPSGGRRPLEQLLPMVFDRTVFPTAWDKDAGCRDPTLAGDSRIL